MSILQDWDNGERTSSGGVHRPHSDSQLWGKNGERSATRTTAAEAMPTRSERLGDPLGALGRLDNPLGSVGRIGPRRAAPVKHQASDWEPEGRRELSSNKMPTQALTSVRKDANKNSGGKDASNACGTVPG